MVTPSIGTPAVRGTSVIPWATVPLARLDQRCGHSSDDLYDQTRKIHDERTETLYGVLAASGRTERPPTSSFEMRSMRVSSVRGLDRNRSIPRGFH